MQSLATENITLTTPDGFSLSTATVVRIADYRLSTTRPGLIVIGGYLEGRAEGAERFLHSEP